MINLCVCVNIYIYIYKYTYSMYSHAHTHVYIYIFHTHSSWCFCHLAEQGGGARQMVGRLEPGSCRGWWTVQCQFHASTHLCLLELHAACFLFSLPLLPQLYFTPQTHTHTHTILFLQKPSPKCICPSLPLLLPFIG